MALKKTYKYKVSTSTGQYLGLLPDPSSEFDLNQTIGSAFAQLDITVPLSADTAGNSVSVLTTENGNPITTESGIELTTENQGDVVGSSNPKTLIQNNNQIQVWEYSQWNPNGIIVFSGYISKWKATFGKTDDIFITCISNGQDLNNYLVPGVPSADQSQIQYDLLFALNDPDPGGKLIAFNRAGQTFTVGAGITKISAIEVWLGLATSSETSKNVTLSVWPNAAAFGGTSLGQAQVTVNSTSATGYVFTFDTPITVTPNTQYFFALQAADSNQVNVAFKDSDVYAGGTMWAASFGGGGGSTAFFNTAPYNGYDLAFTTFYPSTSGAVAYVLDDPTFILNDIMKNYIAAGGEVGVPTPVINQLIQSGFSDNLFVNGSKSTYFCQTFRPTTDLVLNNNEIFNVQLYIGLNIAGPISFIVNLVQGDPTQDTLNFDGANTTLTLGTNNTSLSNGTANLNNPGVTNFLIAQLAPSPGHNITLKAGTQYYISVVMGTTSSGRTQIYGASSGETPSDKQVGRAYIATLNGSGSASPALNNTYPYLYFNLGFINPYPQSSSLFSAYGWTNNILTYTFKLQTMLQAIQTLLGYSPANWYWYVDPATNILQFAQSNTVADFTLIKGRHLDSLEVEATRETIKNIVYFSGGDDGTGTNTNILVEVTNSLNGNRVGLALLSDSRVTSATGSVTAAKLFAQEYANDNAAETYITTVTIFDAQIDTSTIKLGQIAGFAGWGNFVDNLLLQVVGVQRTPDLVVLQLGVLPPRPTQAIAQLQAGLNNTQTGDTSSTPS